MKGVELKIFENWIRIKIIWKKTWVLKIEILKIRKKKLKIGVLKMGVLKIKFENWNFEELFENYFKIRGLKII